MLVCANCMFIYGLTYINSFLFTNLKAIGERRRCVAVTVREVRSITAGMRVSVPTPHGRLLGMAMACSHVAWWTCLPLHVCLTAWFWIVRRPVCTAQEKARPFLANSWVWILTLAPHPKCSFPLKGYIQMTVLMRLHLKIWSLMYLSSVFYRSTHIISKASFSYRLVSHWWPAGGLRRAQLWC